MNFIEEQGNLDDLRNVGNKRHKEQKLKEKVAKMSLEGLPTLKSDEIVEIDGVGSTDNGSWYVEKASHHISQSGSYLTEADLQKNASQKANSTNSKVLDKTAIGDSIPSPIQTEVKTSQGKKMKKYDNNANDL